MILGFSSILEKYFEPGVCRDCKRGNLLIMWCPEFVGLHDVWIFDVDRIRVMDPIC